MSLLGRMAVVVSLALLGSGIASAQRSKEPDWAAVEVLHGRRREYRLNSATRLGLRLRRLLEWTMLPELLFVPVFIVVTPLLWTIDAVRGRILAGEDSRVRGGGERRRRLHLIEPHAA